MPKKGRGKAGNQYSPHALPVLLQAALDALYGHYKKTFDLWQEQKIDVPPVFIVVCNNTSTSKLVHDYIAGFHQVDSDGREEFHAGRFDLFSNFDKYGNRLDQPKTFLIDSEQFESGEALDKSFREIAAPQIEQFKRERLERSGDQRAADNISDQELLREVMNTVGKPDRLGGQIRCVVSVSMLTEGWDANTVTHILGLRAFGTQLLCEQVVGRGLRRQSYELNEKGRFNPEYADILGIPFDFTAEPVVVKPQKPARTIRVQAISPERDHLEIRFPRVEGYRTELPSDNLMADFSGIKPLVLTPNLVGPTTTHMQGIVGEGVDLTVDQPGDERENSILYRLTKHVLYRKLHDLNGEPKTNLFGNLKRIVRQWLDDGYLLCEGKAKQEQVLYPQIADMAAERILAAIAASNNKDRPIEDRPIKAILDPINPIGSTVHVNFTTSKDARWDTSGPPPKCHLNWIMLDSDWEAEFCRVAEAHPLVKAYVKNHALGFDLPYRRGSQPRKYVPDFILKIDDGHGPENYLNLIVEISGYPKGDKEDKVRTMQTYWVPGINNLQRFGRWDFVEFCEVFEIDNQFAKLIEGFLVKEAA